MRIEYHPALQAELEAACAYYEECSVGLGAEFVNEFERQVLLIAAMPSRWEVVERDIRRALMKRFPFVIYFRIVSDEGIRVTVVKHEKRHPSYGIRRK